MSYPWYEFIEVCQEMVQQRRLDVVAVLYVRDVTFQGSRDGLGTHVSLPENTTV